MSARILVVDDDPAVARGVAGLLRDEGYRTEEVHSAAEAWIALHARELPELVLLDIRMPGVDGLEVLAEEHVGGSLADEAGEGLVGVEARHVGIAP